MKAQEQIHTKKDSRSLVLEEGWFSKDEMSRVLHWSASLAGI